RCHTVIVQKKLTHVHGIGQRPAHERAPDDRTELRQTQQAHLQRGVREQEDLERRRDDGQLTPEERHQLTGEQQSVLARFGYRGDVEQNPTPTTFFYGSAFSIVWTTSSDSGSTVGLNRATISPPGAMTNFSKFQRMSPVWPS